MFSMCFLLVYQRLGTFSARLLTFLDDGIGVGASFQEACDISILIKSLQMKSANGVQVKRELG